MWKWLRTKIAHGKLAYQRGKSWGGEALVAGIAGGLAVTLQYQLALALFAASVLIFSILGHLDRTYLKLWQEENRQGSEVNPYTVDMYERLERIERNVDILVSHIAEQAALPES